MPQNSLNMKLLFFIFIFKEIETLSIIYENLEEPTPENYFKALGPLKNNILNKALCVSMLHRHNEEMFNAVAFDKDEKSCQIGIRCNNCDKNTTGMDIIDKEFVTDSKNT